MYYNYEVFQLQSDMNMTIINNSLLIAIGCIKIFLKLYNLIVIKYKTSNEPQLNQRIYGNKHAIY